MIKIKHDRTDRIHVNFGEVVPLRGIGGIDGRAI